MSSHCLLWFLKICKLLLRKNVIKIKYIYHSNFTICSRNFFPASEVNYIYEENPVFLAPKKNKNEDFYVVLHKSNMSWAQNRTSVLNKKIYPAYNMLGIDPAHNMLKIDPAYNMLKIDPTYNTGTRWLTTPCLWGLMRPFGLPRSQQRFLYFIFFSNIFSTLRTHSIITRFCITLAKVISRPFDCFFSV